MRQKKKGQEQNKNRNKVKVTSKADCINTLKLVLRMFTLIPKTSFNLKLFLKCL